MIMARRTGSPDCAGGRAMAEQSANGGSFVKSFLPGLAIGLVIGGLAGAFLGPMVSNPPEPVARKGGPPIVIPLPPGTFDERAPKEEAEKKSEPPGQPPSAPEAPKAPAPESKPAAPASAPK